MALPSERLEAATRLATRTAMLRLVAVFSALGGVELVGEGARWLIVLALPPGEPGGVLGGLTGMFHAGAGGGTWALLFCLVAVVVVAAEAGLLLWAFRPPTDEPASGTLLALGLGGLVARGLHGWAATALSMTLSLQQGVQALASYSIALHVAGMLQRFGSFVLVLASLVLLFARLRREEARAQQGGPYRSSAA